MQTNDILELADSLQVDGLIWEGSVADQSVRTMRSIEMLDLAAVMAVDSFALVDVIPEPTA